MKDNKAIAAEDRDVFCRGLIAADMNWIMIDSLEAPLAVTAKIRYGSRESAALVTPLPDGQVKVVFAEPQRAVTPGQSVVFYDEDKVIGGGIIVKELRG